VRGSYERRNERSCPSKGEEFHNTLSQHQLTFQAEFASFACILCAYLPLFSLSVSNFTRLISFLFSLFFLVCFVCVCE
jgi:hypothetical protein